MHVSKHGKKANFITLNFFGKRKLVESEVSEEKEESESDIDVNYSIILLHLRVVILIYLWLVNYKQI